jgi:hypothetical protein
MSAAYVYKITREDDLVYVGITVNYKKRIMDHTRSERFSIGIKSSEILAECKTYEEAEELEEYYINIYDSFNYGLNKSKNGKGNHLSKKFSTKGFKFSEESRKKMSESAKARGMSFSVMEASRSPKARKKMSETRKGRVWGSVKINQAQINEIMNSFKSNNHPFDNDFITQNVAKLSKNLVGEVSIEKLPSPNGKKLNLIVLYAKYYAKKFGVNKNTIAGILKNDGKRCKHYSEV